MPCDAELTSACLSRFIISSEFERVRGVSISYTNSSENYYKLHSINHQLKLKEKQFPPPHSSIRFSFTIPCTSVSVSTRFPSTESYVAREEIYFPRLIAKRKFITKCGAEDRKENRWKSLFKEENRKVGFKAISFRLFVR